MEEAIGAAPTSASGKEQLNDGRSNDCGEILYGNGVEAAVDTAYWNNADDVQSVCSCILLHCLKTDNTKEAFLPIYTLGKASLFSCILDVGILVTAAAASSFSTAASSFEGMAATAA